MFKRQETKIILIIALALLVFCGTYSLFSHKAIEKIPSQATLPTPVNKIVVKPTQKPIETVEQANSQATLEINGNVYKTSITQNTSVYDFMDKLRTQGKINFKDKTYLGMGKFISDINGVSGNGSENWIYYVNDKKAEIGVSNYKINPGDVVSWKYGKGY